MAIHTVGCSHHPPFTDEGATTDVLPVDLQAHLPGPLPHRRRLSTNYPCSSVATSWSRLVRGGAEGNLLLHHHLLLRTCSTRLRPRKSQGRYGSVSKTHQGIVVSSQTLVGSTQNPHSTPKDLRSSSTSGPQPPGSKPVVCGGPWPRNFT